MANSPTDSGETLNNQAGFLHSTICGGQACELCTRLPSPPPHPVGGYKPNPLVCLLSFGRTEGYLTIANR